MERTWIANVQATRASKTPCRFDVAERKTLRPEQVQVQLQYDVDLGLPRRFPRRSINYFFHSSRGSVGG